MNADVNSLSPVSAKWHARRFYFSMGNPSGLNGLSVMKSPLTLHDASSFVATNKDNKGRIKAIECPPDSPPRASINRITNASVEKRNQCKAVDSVG